MSNKNLTEQNAQRTSFDTLKLEGYELSEEQLQIVSGGCGDWVRDFDKDGNFIGWGVVICRNKDKPEK